jgi:hypothetical protein
MIVASMVKIKPKKSIPLRKLPIEALRLRKLK